MAMYVDADKLTDKLEELQFNAPVMTPVMKIYNVIELVKDQPEVDVVEVVRCKDCKYKETANFNGEILIGAVIRVDYKMYMPVAFAVTGKGNERTILRSEMMFSRQDVRINTKIKDKEELIKLMQPICDFATKHEVSFD